MKKLALSLLFLSMLLALSLGNFAIAEVDYWDDPVINQNPAGVKSSDYTDVPTPLINQTDVVPQGTDGRGPDGIYHGTPCSNKEVELKVERFESGKMKGWKVRLPETLPLATPALADGMLFIGGGFGSYSFYALDAKTGAKRWAVQTGDDGPTAAIAYKGRVLFNTESCILYCLNAADGKEVWNWWLGDPLMSQPAAYEDKVYIAYPGHGGHKLGCLALSDGAVQWTKPIIGELISAPVVNDGSVYATCLEGTVYKYSYDSGLLAWSRKQQGTSAPFIVGDQVYLSMRTETTVGNKTQQHEGLMGMGGGSGAPITDAPVAMTKADYLDSSKQATGAHAEKQAALDSSVGFGSAPESAKIGQATENLGVSSVSGVWAYQGSRPVVKDGISYNAQGDFARAVEMSSGKVIWEKEYKAPGEGGGSRSMTPPALVNGKMFLGTSDGKIICMSSKDGKELWSVSVGSSVRFTPAVMYGRVYVGTDDGNVVCIETGDEKDTGWAMWGGNASHNGWQWE